MPIQLNFTNIPLDTEEGLSSMNPKKACIRGRNVKTGNNCVFLLSEAVWTRILMVPDVLEHNFY